MGGKEDVKLFGMWASPYAFIIEVALKLKRIEYEYIEEDLSNKSPLLLQYNPVYKKIPVLVHAGKPIPESFVILEYIDETWKQNPILPEDPYERAMARFWAKFVEEKCLPASFSVFSKLGEEKEKAVEEFTENFKILEGFLKGKQFFAGENIGFVDIFIAWIPKWVRHIEEVVGTALVQEQNLPLLNAWFARILEFPIVKETLPPHDKQRAYLQRLRESIIASSA